MLCTHCRHFAATPGGSLCPNCAAAAAPVPAGSHPAAGGLPVAPPLGAGGGPPGAPAFGTAPLDSPHGPAWLRSPVALGNATAALLGLVIATDLFALYADVTMRDVTGRLTDGVTGSGIERDADHADSLYLAAGVAQVAALLATAVVFLVWFRRARVNAEVFDPHGHRKGRGWAGWGWFVPVVNLWIPRRIMVDIWDASSPWPGRAGHGLVNCWWTFWIVALFAKRGGSSAYRRADTAAELHRAVGQVMFADVVDVAAAALAVAVVLRLTRMQDLKARQGPAPAGV
ncbi:DUF4328 domain-containing protein [Streptomyces sp. NPDC005907]|uniref:DUF4328 domain-containing protein n=1 Tax=Streptomyces sp. NPDC005907 TaxID=3154571 RepID=UPI0033D18B7E